MFYDLERVNYSYMITEYGSKLDDFHLEMVIVTNEFITNQNIEQNVSNRTVLGKPILNNLIVDSNIMDLTKLPEKKKENLFLRLLKMFV